MAVCHPKGLSPQGLSDCRVAISRRRATKRTSVSVATLAQVNSNTTPAIPRRMDSDDAIYTLPPKGDRHSHPKGSAIC
jgi:hypothetical protein